MPCTKYPSIVLKRISFLENTQTGPSKINISDRHYLDGSVVKTKKVCVAE
jgi:hypothetical protein